MAFDEEDTAQGAIQDYSKTMGIPTEGHALTDNLGRWCRTFSGYVEQRCDEAEVTAKANASNNVDTAVEHLEKLTAVEFHTFPDVRHEAVSQMRYANPSASDETRSDDEDETRVYVSSPHASSTERRLAASATEWGFPRKSAVEEAFLRHRAKLHVEAKRRERREAMKDPTRRLQRLKASEAKNETSRRNI